MTGKELFKEKTKRDFSGSASDLYAQDLMSIFMHVGADLFPLLEKAESENKKIEVKRSDDDEIIISDLFLV